MTAQPQTRQQRRAAKRNERSPWKDVPVSPSEREKNRARYRVKKAEAQRLADRVLPSLDAVV